MIYIFNDAIQYIMILYIHTYIHIYPQRIALCTAARSVSSDTMLDVKGAFQAGFESAMLKAAA